MPPQEKKVPIHKQIGDSIKRPIRTAPLDITAIQKGHFRPLICPDLQKPNNPTNNRNATPGKKNESIPIDAIPKDVSTPPAAVAHAPHLANGTTAAIPPLITPTDLKVSFIEASPTRLLSASQHQDLFRRSTLPIYHQLQQPAPI